MERQTAEQIAKKVVALKHCNKLLKEIERKGKVVIKINCTGLELVAEANDVLHMRLKTLQASLAEQINSYEIIKKATLENSSKKFG